MSWMQSGWIAARRCGWAAAIVAALGAVACEDDLILYVDGLDGSVPGLQRYQVARSEDDGVVRVVRSLLPEQANGYVFSDSSDLIVGNLSDGTNVVASRAVLRFNLTGWTSGFLTLNLMCNARSGSPTSMQVYVVDDPGSLPVSTGGPSDVSGWWNLPDSGVLIGTMGASDGQVSHIDIPDNSIREHLSASRTIGIVVAYDTTRLPGEYYSFASFDNVSVEGRAPYLERNALQE